MKCELSLRAAYLLRIEGYFEISMVSMWVASERAPAIMGMAEASVRGAAPDARDEEPLEELRGLILEAREYYEGQDFPAAMARMRAAGDLLSIHIITLCRGND